MSKIGNVSWYKIKTLVLRQLYFSPWSGQKNQKEQQNMKARFIHFITCNITNIHTLECLIIDADYKKNIIGNKLVNYYASSLQSIKSLSPIEMTVKESSAQLTYLQMTVPNDNTVHIPIMCRNSLRHLSLTNMPEDYVWRLSKNSGICKDIVFQHLKTLEIYYKLDFADNHDMNNLHYISNEGASVLHFPTLQNLSLYRCHRHCQILESAKLPVSMKSLSLQCFSSLLPNILSRNWTFLGKLNISLDWGINSDSEAFIECTNTLFGMKCISSNSTATITEIPKLFSTKFIKWKYLSSITISHGVVVPQLLSLLSGLPNLLRLAALLLYAEDMPRRAPNPIFVNKGWFTAVNDCTLHTAILQADNILQFSPDYLEFVRDFVQGHKSLAHLGVSPTALAFIKGITETGSDIYPHFAKIRVETARI
ncbi:hypothetical protein COEREDRAFT_86240 [Coemansia reversa NRRL 1564]|uniref:F-box domain-containing protein n=1 Tax=Coemansia reversa (strain ATCC 12441 / NRRL 1564) TaxID=763665 RepID=A0A2G5BDZ3_COERN|nr:hypothetical protein COEREDRAFT_86240 [Coemansia reversa NRRL 1564]|eukprot:PIA17240.1 hypothetical protein COEREDRAFT_86240 [Coemansia reversa NRRL 1564]